MSSDLLIRDYRVADLDPMFRLDEVCFTPEFRFDRGAMEDFSSYPGAVVRVAEASDEIVGFVIVHLQRLAAGLQGYVVTLDVAKEFRRRSVAQGLMSEVEESAASKGARWMELHVHTENIDAIRFYERAGYIRVTMKPGFYGKRGLDAFVYRKTLPIL